MQRSTDRILTTHVGSLIRPDALRQLIWKRERGDAIDAQDYETTLANSVQEVVTRQAEIGIDIPSDGEFGKTGWTSYVMRRLNGLQPRQRKPGDPAPIDPRTAGRDGEKFAAFYKAYDPVQMYDWTGPEFFTSGRSLTHNQVSGLVECIGPITYRDDEIKRDIANFKAALKNNKVVEAFMPVAAPESARGVRYNRYYPSDDAFLAAMGDALRTEYKAIVDAGFLIQLDDAYCTHEFDRLLVTHTEAEVIKMFSAYVEMLNHALDGIPEEKIRYHVCWGSWNGPHTSDVPLKTLLELILKVKAQAYSLEAAGPRHEHEYQIWEEVKLPEGKVLLPGFISHATNVVEHPELVSLRIRNFAKLVGRENVIASTDCGFSQNWNNIRVHPQVQWAKLKALVDGARHATKILWS